VNFCGALRFGFFACFIDCASWRWIWMLSSIGRVGAGTGSVHQLGELALELEAFTNWAGWHVAREN